MSAIENASSYITNSAKYSTSTPLQVAEFMVASGLKDAGYTYFNLDDYWQTDRDFVSSRIIDSVLDCTIVLFLIRFDAQ